MKGSLVCLKAPDGDRFIVVNEHEPENLIYDRTFLGMDRSPDFILIQVTSTVGNTKDLNSPSTDTAHLLTTSTGNADCAFKTEVTLRSDDGPRLQMLSHGLLDANRR